MPFTPVSVRRFEPPIVTRPPGLVTLTVPHVRSAPRRVELAPVTVASQSATSAAPGTTPPTQLVPKLRLSVLLALTIWALALKPPAKPVPISAAMLADRTKRHGRDDVFMGRTGIELCA